MAVCRTAGRRLRLPWDLASWGLWGAEPCGWASVVVAGARVIYAQATARPNIVELYPSDWPFAAQHPSSTRHYCVGGIGRPISA